MAAALMALHVTAHGKSLATAGMGAAEGLLARVRVGVDAQRRRAGKGLVAGSADIPVIILLVRGSGGRWEIVMVLPCGSHWGDERR